MAQKWPKIAQNCPIWPKNDPKLPKWPKNDPKWPQKLAPAEKNSTDISAGTATFCISEEEQDKVDDTMKWVGDKKGKWWRAGFPSIGYKLLFRKCNAHHCLEKAFSSSIPI